MGMADPNAAESDVRSDLRAVADKLSNNATYDDAFYELHLRMKLTEARNDVEAGRMVTQDEIEREFL